MNYTSLVAFYNYSDSRNNTQWAEMVIFGKFTKVRHYFSTESSERGFYCLLWQPLTISDESQACPELRPQPRDGILTNLAKRDQKGAVLVEYYESHLGDEYPDVTISTHLRTHYDVHYWSGQSKTLYDISHMLIFRYTVLHRNDTLLIQDELYITGGFL